MRVQLRIVSGALRGRKVACVVTPELRPTPDMVRQALFSILGHAVPGRPFFDFFAGSGIVGLEALSRGASQVLFLEREPRLAHQIEQHARTFGMTDQARILRTDVYRWAENWQPPSEPVNVYLSPPFGDIEHRPEALLALVARLRQKLAVDSVLVLQSERQSPLDDPKLWE